ncbi:unnamed protein product [Rotaria magnacalcarata]|uniref:RNA helicase n=1 Tax=Rotaria magnacalcarata TaxID=392030 RepID=A0A816RYM1_9BILA|nr:unnamed protein product [Rotaria magnacalcarata]CAF3865269.1 unnamed protein product [Rotaria magnacalcarata]
MKPSRLARRFNKKGRQQKKIVIEQNSSTNVIVEGETTTADNNSILPSKKRTTHAIHQKAPAKRKLSKKERKRLEKVLDVKKKKAKRVELLDQLGQVQISNDELALLHSVKNIGSKAKRQPFDSHSSTLTSSPLINFTPLSKKRPAQLPTESILNESESSSDEDDDETINDEEIRKALAPSQPALPVVAVPLPTVKKRQREDSTSSTEETKIDIPARPHANVQVDRSEEMQALRSQLPIITEEQAIMEAIHDNLVVLICGETGSGKTTQLPQFLYEAGYTLDGKMIGITEPRRVAAISMATRVAQELNLTNEQVSYQIRYEGTFKQDTTRIKFMTDGVLLKEVQNDFLLTKYSCILIDEAHERSVATDVLIGLLSRIVPIRCRRNDPLRLVIMSATMRIEEFVSNRHLFKLKPKIINIDARQFPVTIHFNKQTPKNYINEAFKKVCKIHRQLPSGGILVFVTGQQEVQTLCHQLRKKFPMKTQTEDDDEPQFKTKKFRKEKRTTNGNRTSLDIIDEEELEHLQSDIDEDEEKEQEQEEECTITSDLDDEDTNVKGISFEPLYVLPIYAILSSEKQARVFEPPPPGTRLCVIATNVAETSITISNVKYIVDCGKVKTKHYDKLTGVSTFRIEWTSKASASQRTGRAGRTAPGHCYRLYSSAIYNDSFAEYTAPEIVRKPVEDLVLQLKTLKIDRLANFPFPTSPDLKAINVAEQLLIQLNALDSKSPTKTITELGRRMSAFPINPRYSKMLVIAQENKDILPYVIALVATLSVNEVLASGLVKIQKNSQELCINLDDVRRQWIGQGEPLLFGDMMVLLKAVGALDHQNSKNDLSICTRYGLRPKAMTEIRKIRRQLTQIVKSILPETATVLDARLLPPSEQQICLLRKVLAAGMVDRLAKKIEGSVVINGHKANNAYQTLLLEEPVFIHPSSVLANDSPPFVCYQELHETSRIFIKDICAIQMDWIVQINPHLCSFGPIEEEPSPRYDETQDKLLCHRKATIGQRVSWSLGPPVETIFSNNTVDRYRWFAKFFLDGIICPRLLQFRPALLCSSNAMVKSWASLMERTQLLLNALVAKDIDSRTQLKEVWSAQPKYLLDVYCDWLPESLHAQVRSLWPPVPSVLKK